jgi:hypothetical protein
MWSLTRRKLERVGENVQNRILTMHTLLLVDLTRMKINLIVNWNMMIILNRRKI